MNNTIQFHSGTPATEVLRLSKDGIWANPEIPADDAAKLVLEAIDANIKILVQKAVLAEREACAKVAGWLWQQFQDTKEAHERNSPEPFRPERFGFDQSTVQQSKRLMDAIRARGNT
jgi:hypothetical protein